MVGGLVKEGGDEGGVPYGVHLGWVGWVGEDEREGRKGKGLNEEGEREGRGWGGGSGVMD